MSGKLFQGRAEEYGCEIAGQVQLKAGDVINVFGCPHMVIQVNESCAKVRSTSKKTVVIREKLKDKTTTFEQPMRDQRISRNLDRTLLLERQGDSGVAYFLAHKTVRGAGEQTTTTDTEETENNSMSKKTKATKKTNHTPNTAASKGRLGNIMDFSVCSVIARLGLEGVSVAHVREIMKAQKAKASNASIQIFTSRGRNGKCTVATLTGAQVKELIASAPAPQAEPKAEKAPKAAKAAKAPKAKKVKAEKASVAKDPTPAAE